MKKKQIYAFAFVIGLILGCAKKSLIKHPIEIKVTKVTVQEPAIYEEIEKPQKNKIVIQHKIVSGDTLWDLSGNYLGDSFLWPVLWRANRDFIAEPDWIEVGDTLNIHNEKPSQKDLDKARSISKTWPQSGYKRGKTL